MTPFLLRRILAFGVDGALGLAQGLVLFGLLGAQPLLLLSLATAPLFACLITLSTFSVTGTHGPGKHLLGLTLSGQGCLPCRQMRLWLPLSLPPLVALIAPASMALLVGVAVAALALRTPPHWETATGLTTKPL